jgi:hypothetical protein
MADIFGVKGKIAAMEGIETAIAVALLCDSLGTIISSATVNTTDFTTNATTGQLSNSTAISFAITAGMVGETAAIVKIANGDATPAVLIQLDLDTPLLLTTEGTATFAIGDLTADL